MEKKKRSKALIEKKRKISEKSKYKRKKIQKNKTNMKEKKRKEKKRKKRKEKAFKLHSRDCMERKVQGQSVTKPRGRQLIGLENSPRG